MRQGIGNMRALVVDDNATMRSILNKMLSKLGVLSVSLAADGVEALKLLSQNAFDVIIIDWEMPVLNGLETIQHIRKELAHLRTLPVIVMSASLDPKRMQEAAESGVLFYLFKPFTEAALRDRLEVIARLGVVERFFLDYRSIGADGSGTGKGQEIVEI